MPIVNLENSTESLGRVLHPVLYVQGPRGEMTVSTEKPENGLYYQLLNLSAEDFGDPEFKKTYGLRYASAWVRHRNASGKISYNETAGEAQPLPLYFFTG